ncbi:vicilin-like seed storage At2g28490 [Olea europaea subsp. europaea]|uniref:Vicilin-like seed storage At2g28490 n=1 Tax=Olea europaea subsp. europaea TaxID=158383 RepID=A0A8S0QGX6_OLEEU|nr:vicilin-like seed storage At2g28490 [Olea europaea subsp. europaea]
MGRRWALFLLVVVVCCALVAGVGGNEDDWRWEEEEGGEGSGEEGGAGRPEGVDWFLLQDSKQVVKTDAGKMSVVRGFGGKYMKSPMHIGYINMEPKSLFIPQYLDSSLILFIREGEAKIGHIYKDEVVEKHLRAGDIHRIEAGLAFYLINTEEGRTLNTICSIDSSKSLEWRAFKSFFIGGGTYPMSILSGFYPLKLSTAFNVSVAKLKELLTRQQAGPIISLSNSHSPSIWTGFFGPRASSETGSLKESCSFEERQKRTKSTKKSDYWPLGKLDTGIYLVNLSTGSMMAPHINPRVTLKPASVLGGDKLLLRTIRGPEFANAFRVSEERLSKILNS